MTRKKIQIKKIDNLAARQVTFSKRRKGLFKKAQELATLCDADIALIVFSASGKLFDCSSSSSSVQKVVEKLQNQMHGDWNFQDQINSSSQMDNNGVDTKMREEVMKKTLELRQMRGEQLQGLSLEELKRLEASIQMGLRRVLEKKDEQFLREVVAMKNEEILVMEENQILEAITNDEFAGRRFHVGEAAEHLPAHGVDNGRSSFLDHNSSADTCLKLGL